MALLDNFLKLFPFRSREKANVSQQIFDDLVGAFAGAFGTSNKKEVELYTGWVFACVNAIAQEVATMEVGLFSIDKDGSKEPVLDHPALNLLQNVNDFFTYYTLLWRLQSNIELFGNEYWLLSRGLGGKGDPQLIFPLIPALVKPIPADNPVDYIKEYQYNLGGSILRIPPEHVIQFKTYNPASDIVGVGTLQAAKLPVITDDEIKSFNANFFNKKAAPGAVIEYDGKLTQAQVKKFKRQWQEVYGGAGNAGKALVLQGGLKLGDLMKLSHADMEFTEQRRFLRDEILAIFRVSKIILGITEDVNRASAEAAIFTFVRVTILPKMKTIVESLNEFYLPKFTDSENLKFELLTKPPDDRQTTISGYVAGLNNGFLTINEIRRREGLQEVEGGDQLYIPFGLQPAGQPVKHVQNMSKKCAKIAHTHGGLTEGLVESIMKMEKAPNSKKKTKKRVIM